MSEIIETVNQDNNAEQERTFTQAEVDAIVGDRLKRDRAKYADYDALREKAAKLDQLEEASKTELQRATERADALQKELDAVKADASAREMREKIATETGVPIVLLTGDTEEVCRQQAAMIKTLTSPGYPQVKDAGEMNRNMKLTPQQQFAEWAEAAFG